MAALMVLAAPVMARPSQVPRRVVSLDQCADQYVMALMPRDQIAGVSHRADDADSHFALKSKGLRFVRPSADSLLRAGVTDVVRSWGGDARLLATLRRHGVRVHELDYVTDLDRARTELVRIADLLDSTDRARPLLTAFDQTRARYRGALNGQTALYYTPSGFTSGDGSFVNALLREAGLTNLEPVAKFHPLGPERVLTAQPDLYVLGFYDDTYRMRRAPGRHPLVLNHIQRARHVALPGRLLGCPAWFAVEALERLARKDRA
ncbi:MAG: ABC transporter substrate-binding protein [Asticcacaulis sp.]